MQESIKTVGRTPWYEAIIAESMGEEEEIK